jgi:hypothetical protein
MAAGVNVWHALGFAKIAPCVVTSGNDSKHGPNSLHGFDKALDFRTHSLPSREAKLAFRDAMRGVLGRDYDVILEDLGGPNEHLHAERDPKGAPSQIA